MARARLATLLVWLPGLLLFALSCAQETPPVRVAAEAPIADAPTALPPAAPATAVPTEAPANPPAVEPTWTPVPPTATLAVERLNAEAVGTAPGMLAGLPLVQVDEGSWRVLYRRAGWRFGQAVDLRAVGDVMLGRGVSKVARAEGLDFPLRAALGLLDGDMTIGNLESPLTDRGPANPGEFTLFAATAFGEPLRGASFDALSLANNHGMDVGPAGLEDAATTLAALGIAPFGAGADEDAAYVPAVLESAGLRVALLGFNDVPADGADRADRWGRAWLGDRALAAVSAAQEQADLVVVVVHWGNEYVNEPVARQQEWAQALVAAGADLIVGAHPHWLEPAVPLSVDGRDGYVAYSLGNFVFDQSWSRRTGIGSALRVMLDREGVALVAAAPVEIVRGQPQPAPLDGEIAAEALMLLGATSEPAVVETWHWESGAAVPAQVLTDGALTRPTVLQADLHGNGQPLWAALGERGQVAVYESREEGTALVWQHQSGDGFVRRIDAGDVDGDGRPELLLALWKPDVDGVPRSHPELVGGRDNQIQVVWAGAETERRMQDAALGDLDGDGRAELALLEGGNEPGDPGETVSVWRWQRDGFELVWRSEPGAWLELALRGPDDAGPGAISLRLTEAAALLLAQQRAESAAVDATGLASGFRMLPALRTLYADAQGVCARPAPGTDGQPCPADRLVRGGALVRVAAEGPGEPLAVSEGGPYDVWYYGEGPALGGETLQGYFHSGAVSP